MLQILFPTEILQKRILSAQSSLHKQLLVEAYKFKKIDTAGKLWSAKNYPGGYTSYGSMPELYLNSPTFKELQKKIDQAKDIYVRELEMDINPKELKMCSMWVNIMSPRALHSMHIHPLAVVSGTYYVELPKAAPGLKLEDPRMTQFMATPPRKPKARVQHQRFVELKPKPGQVILFESWLRHEVLANPTQQDRISISFNYHWK